MPRRHVVAGVVAGLVVALAIAWLVWPFWSLSGQFGRAPLLQPSRLYSAPLTLEAGAPLALDRATAHLEAAGYRATEAGDLLPGEYRRKGGRLAVYLRSFPTPRGWTAPQRVIATWRDGRVRGIELEGRTVERVWLEPVELAAWYGPERKDRRPVRLAEVPEDLVLAVLAAEDAGFFEHGGISVPGILRAALANLRSGGISQGGSTLTQQLVKNLFLTHERTVSRKLREIALAVVVDMRYSKEEILQAYLNEIYLGARGSLNLMGVGSAAWAFYGKHPSRLTLGEAATIAGIIPAPGRYSPLEDEAAAKERRDLVLRRLEELGWVEPERIAAARAEPIRLNRQAVGTRRAPYFADHALGEAAARFGVTRVADGGYAILSTLSWEDQQAADEAVAWGVKALEEGWEKGREDRDPLQASLVSVDPLDGGIRAYVGGRSYKESQYDRAGEARRQAGSAFKPVVYAAALGAGVVNPGTLVEDSPLELRLAGKRWSPENSDREYRGWVTVRQALEKSLNVPTVRVALATGMPRIVELASRMGVAPKPAPVPAVALGAVEVTGVELATVYATLASGGVRPPVHGLVGVLAPSGEPVAGQGLSDPERVMSPAVAYVVTAMLQGVVNRGTGAGVRRMGLSDPLAGKTGTSNDQRDSWFAGYAPDRVAVVWVGYDENLPTRLGGARAGVPIWGRFMAKVRPPGGYDGFPRPDGVTTAVIDPATGELAVDDCPVVVREVFLEGRAPDRLCHLHAGWWDRPVGTDGELAPGEERRQEDDNPVRRWLRDVFGDDDGGGAAGAAR